MRRGQGQVPQDDMSASWSWWTWARGERKGALCSKGLKGKGDWTGGQDRDMTETVVATAQSSN